MTDVHTRVHLDRADRRVTVERIQDCDPILAVNRELEQLPQKGDFRHIGTIPNVLIERWLNEEGANVLAMSGEEFARFIRQKLDDPQYLYLRTAPRLRPYRAGA